MKIIFFGSSHFAVPALEGLIKNRHKILCVVTQPDKKKGRHLHLGFTDIKSLAFKSGLDVFQPTDINEAESLRFLKSLNADIFVIVSYGQLLSQAILDIPKVMPLNIHASLLPKYRGAAPINWAVIRGEEKTGVTIMKVTRKMDSGAIIIQESISIKEDDNAVSLGSKLSDMGAQLLLRVLPGIKSGKYELTAQDEKEVTYAPKLKKGDGLIHWDSPAKDILNLIRGAVSWPGAFTHYRGKMLKVYRGKVIRQRAGVPAGCLPGQLLDVSKDGICVLAGKDALLIQELQIEGGRRMETEEFISGHKILLGEHFK